MKKSIILTGAIALALGFQSCQKGDDGAQAAKDWATIDSVSNMKATAFSDSLNNACMMDATAKGMAMGDSMVNASKKGGSKGGTKPKTTTVVTPPPPVDPKKDKMSGNTQSSTEAKKDKMSGNGTNTNTDAKKDKMNGKPK